MSTAEAKKKPVKEKAAKTKTSKGALMADHLYDVIVSPIITEKATAATEQNKVTFRIAKDANKALVKQAVEALFGVKVEKVNTINIGGKTKLFRGRPGKRADVRKAVVTLAEGQSIDIAAGLK